MPCYHCAGWWWWCNGVGGCFLDLMSIGHRLNATAYLSIVSDHAHLFMATMYPSSDGYFQQYNVTKLEPFQIGFLNMTMSSLY